MSGHFIDIFVTYDKTKTAAGVTPPRVKKNDAPR